MKDCISFTFRAKHPRMAAQDKKYVTLVLQMQHGQPNRRGSGSGLSVLVAKPEVDTVGSKNGGILGNNTMYGLIIIWKPL
jgi:hypothetical protein